MLLNLTERSSEPLHDQIARQLTEKIVEGDISAGEKLPSVRALARSAHVNVGTVNRAYSVLESEGLIQSDQDTFYFVASLSLDQKQAIAFRHHLDKQSPLNVIDQFSKQLISVFETETLRNIFRDMMRTTFGVPDLYFGTWDGLTCELLPTSLDKSTAEISATDSLLSKLMESNRPCRLSKIEMEMDKGSLQAELIERNVRIVLPLRDADQFLGFMAVPQNGNSRELTDDEMDLLNILAHQFVTALTTSRLYTEAMANRRMESELQIARQIQTGLLPKSMPNNGRFSTATYIQPSQAVGGDFYDCIVLDDHRYAFVIADACGDGLPAAMLISQLQGMVRSELLNGNDIHRILINVNHQIMEYTPKDKFITLFLGIFDAANNRLTYSSAGHDYPICVDSIGAVSRFTAGGPALGLMQTASFETETVDLKAGDNILFFTDGMTEAMNQIKEIYGEDRLAASLNRHNLESAQELATSLTADLEAFADGDSSLDDRTMMILKIHDHG